MVSTRTQRSGAEASPADAGSADARPADRRELRAPLLKADASLVVITIVWGVCFVIVKSALDNASAMLFLSARFAVATFAAAFWFRKRLTQGGSASIRGGILAGLFLFVAYATQTMGLRLTTASKSAFITGLCVVMVPLLAALVYRKGPQPGEALGAVMAGIGLMLMTLPAEGVYLEMGDLLTLACAVAFAGHILLIGYLAHRTRFETVAVVQLGVTALLCGASAGWMEPAFWRGTPELWAAIVFTGIFATSAAFAVQAWAQQFVSTTRAAVIFALEPVAAWVAAFAIFGETLGARAILGAGLIVAGILFAELKPFSLLRHPSK